MKIKFSQELLTILIYAREEAMRTGSYGIGADHLVLGMLRHRDNDACRALSACGIDADALKEQIDGHILGERSVPWEDQQRIRPTRGAAALLGGAAYEALKQGQSEIFSSHLLLSLSRFEGSTAAELIRSSGSDYASLHALMREHRYILPRPEEPVLPPMEDLLGPLGEQLTRLYSDAQAQTNYIS